MDDCMSSLVIKSIHRDEKIATSIKDGEPAAEAAATEEELLEKEDVPKYEEKKSNYLAFVAGEVCNRFLCFCTARPPLI